MKKLYCYVDETGQDTLGKLFIVAIIVTDEQRDKLETFLESLEMESGKKKRKWIKARTKEQVAYIEGFIASNAPAQLFARVFTGRVDAYDDLEVMAATQAINLYREKHGIADDYKVTIAIDGLTKSLRPRVGRSFRLLGVKTRNVHGERDQSSPIIRLADAVAGLVRDSVEGCPEFKKLESKLKMNNKLYKL
jgi:hypothetical protein